MGTFPFSLLLLYVLAYSNAQYLANAPTGYTDLICGVCDDGYERSAPSGPFCGPCKFVDVTCTRGTYRANGQCHKCPCPANGSERFGSSCSAENGAVVCNCSEGYTGRNCNQCAPGYVQLNYYPYTCYKPSKPHCGMLEPCQISIPTRTIPTPTDPCNTDCNKSCDSQQTCKCCSKCPDPCKECPTIPSCPDCICNVTCNATIECPTAPTPIVEDRQCMCDPRGTMFQDRSTCFCKVNVEGHACNTCKKGYFGLSASSQDGCQKCFCSGVSDYCKAAVLHKVLLVQRSGQMFQIVSIESSEIRTITSVFSSGALATYSGISNKKLLWLLPLDFFGDRVTSYGGRLSCGRKYEGSGADFGNDHDVIIMGRNGNTMFWSSYDTLLPTKETTFSVELSERGRWIVGNNGTSMLASRQDILAVLADVVAIYVRASFRSTTISTSIRDCTLETVSPKVSKMGFAMDVEMCSCPRGYQGLSCQSCSAGYYRDAFDMSKSILGACKKCPCGAHANGCKIDSGVPVCICKSGFIGPLCQDRKILSLTLDPFMIRELANAEVEFNCSYITNAKSAYTLEISTEPEGIAGASTSTTTLQTFIKLTQNLQKVKCTLKDIGGMEVACVTATIIIVSSETKTMAAPPSLVSVTPEKEFICQEEGEDVILKCDSTAYGAQSAIILWRKEGEYNQTLSSRPEYIIRNSQLKDAGTYICSSSVGDFTSLAKIVVVIRESHAFGEQMVQDDSNDFDDIPIVEVEPLDLMVKVEDPTFNDLEDISSELSVFPTEYDAYPGENVNFKCFSSNPTLKIKWSKVGGALPNSSEEKADGLLALYRVSGPNSGDYLCSAIEPNGKAQQVLATLSVNKNNVFTPPKIQLHPRSPHRVRSGHSVRLECDSFGEPNPTVTWTRFIEGVEVLLAVSRNSSVGYEIAYVTKEDGGKYTCTATNKVDNKVESLALMVDDAIVCKPVEFRCKSGDQCVKRDFRCDGEKDCKDESDEHHCRHRSTHRSLQSK